MPDRGQDRVRSCRGHGDWLNQVLAYALLDWSDALGVDTVAVYLGWQALLISETLAHVLAAATAGRTPTLEKLRADFRSAMQADIDESFAKRSTWSGPD